MRAARNSGSFFEKRDMMLTLVFLRFIGEKYEDGVENLRQTLVKQGLDPDDEDIVKAFFDDASFKGWALTPSKYIEFIDHDLDIDYPKEMARIQAEMKEIMKEEKKSQTMLEEAFSRIIQSLQHSQSNQ